MMHLSIFLLYVYDYVFEMIKMHAKKVSTSVIYVFENLIIELHACSFISWKPEVVKMITMSLSCWVRVLLRNIISHINFFILSLDSDSIPGGVDHESTRVWVVL